MTILEIKEIIKESSKELAKDPDYDGHWETGQLYREFIIETANQLIDCELYKIEELVHEFGEKEFGSEEEDPDRPPIYEKLHEVDKHLNAIRKLAEVKSYLQAKNAGEMEGVFGPVEKLEEQKNKE